MIKMFLGSLLLVSSRIIAQEYTYDANGSLGTDGNKQISSVHYNYLNLADTITYSDNRRIIYSYTAAGQKLREQSINADGTTLKKRDYDHQVLYTGNVLQEIQHEEGRLVPVTPGNTSSSFEYQYHLNDHLGNVRTMLTSNPGTNNNIAAFETSSVNDEQRNFTDYDKARRVNSILFDHTKTGITHYSQRLNGSANEKYGIAKSLSVMPGDTVKLETYAKYVDPNRNNLTAALTTMLSQIATGAASTGTVIDGAGYAGSGNTPFPFAGLNNTSDGDGKGPKAYLNWLVFDRNFVFKTGGHVKMSEAGKENGSNVKHEKLEKQLIITQPGYVYAYLSNEETTPVDVYFDDFSVTQANSPVIQQTDYDPFGLTFNEYARENTAPNDFLYNGKELQKDFDLNWYDYGARMYDVTLGRWHVIDPMAEKYDDWSPYNYVKNNPVNRIDPDGKNVVYIHTEDVDDEATFAEIQLLSTPTGRKVENEASGATDKLRLTIRPHLSETHDISEVPTPSINGKAVKEKTFAVTIALTGDLTMDALEIGRQFVKFNIKRTAAGRRAIAVKTKKCRCSEDSALDILARDKAGRIFMELDKLPVERIEVTVPATPKKGTPSRSPRDPADEKEKEDKKK